MESIIYQMHRSYDGPQIVSFTKPTNYPTEFCPGIQELKLMLIISIYSTPKWFISFQKIISSNALSSKWMVKWYFFFYSFLVVKMPLLVWGSSIFCRWRYCARLTITAAKCCIQAKNQFVVPMHGMIYQ